MEAQAAVYLTAKQNGKILQDKSLFTYTKYKVRGSIVYYYCSKKTVYNCKVTAKVDLSMEPNITHRSMESMNKTVTCSKYK